MLTFYDVPFRRNISLTHDVSRVADLHSRMIEKSVMRSPFFFLKCFLKHLWRCVMMSLNDADPLRQKLQENGFDAEQANGTMAVVDEMVDHGIDRVLDRISDLESKMQDSIGSVRSDMDARFDVIDERFTLVDKRFDAVDKQFKLVDKRFDLIDRRLKAGLVWQPMISTVYTVLLLGAIVTLAYRLPDIIKWLS